MILSTKLWTILPDPETESISSEVTHSEVAGSDIANLSNTDKGMIGVTKNFGTMGNIVSSKSSEKITSSCCKSKST